MAALTEAEKKKIDGLRKKNSLKSMYYTRYFLIRYVVAFFFFVNLYWLLLLSLSGAVRVAVLPLALAACGAACMWEQYQMYAEKQKPARMTWLYFQLVIIINGLLILAVFVNRYHYFYPFLAVSSTVQFLLAGVLAAGIALAAWMLAKIRRINQKKDKQYYRIQQYLATIK
ncbi:hypothetical protein DDV21_005810 [Streptococcus chenjunshii]|uniref:PTS cellobiose transporter subunit IIA n=1 Tax=Streptococcus chenjunshii TaxID=2173853 RepID=A0A372KP98_9STRE|nr:hypothetical protein [Streptococcus chenjunshii]AXQ78627.1 hypothetical protein DDV21_005810 [Streptococcus chenjunshii]RFU51909.1 hypothetical protein DDV22_00235 [Streptococcus chenjunshii]RFU54101.1 hypothetical protein DDV23_00790 [Streptococcus chenjunshii]